MTYAIVYSSKTGNTKMLADTIRETLTDQECVYCGPAVPDALQADTLYVGFWTDKGTCDKDTEAFLKTIQNKPVFLFGTCGFGVDPNYFSKILKSCERYLNQNCTVIGSFMCQGKMPMSVRERYVKMKAAPVHMPNIDGMIANFDLALTHPDQNDLDHLKQEISK
ncbi:MAG: flavodoxin family protein [Solobacterium sp.]|jgi:flavodoxin|nr:flavodoxin family protein [Solobacterium sp.]MCH4222543.1 flavodoxin family protein [Solobacterium sp.]MCH4265475.1 flavodoxin family protein [Solobacterium sp.]